MATNLTDDNNCIQPGLRADIMRSSMENKNLLAKKGSIYVGTGKTQTVGGQTIPTTEALQIGSNNEVLRVEDGNLKYGKLINGNFDPYTTYLNLTNTVQSVAIKPSQISGEYSGLALKNKNISTSEQYSNLVLVGSDSNRNTSVSSGLLGTLQLQQNSTSGKLSMTIKDPIHLYRYTIKLTVEGSFRVNNQDTYDYSGLTFYVTGVRSAVSLSSVTVLSPLAFFSLTGFHVENYSQDPNSEELEMRGFPSYIDITNLTIAKDSTNYKLSLMKRMVLTGGVQLRLWLGDMGGTRAYGVSILHWKVPASGSSETTGAWVQDDCTIISNSVTEVYRIS